MNIKHRDDKGIWYADSKRVEALEQRIASLEEWIRGEIAARPLEHSEDKRIAVLEDHVAKDHEVLINVGDLADGLESEGKDYEKRISALEDRCSAIEEKINDSDAWTVENIAVLEDRCSAIEEKINDSDDWTIKRIAELEERLSARIAALEDRLDFYRTQKDNEKEERIAALESRVTECETDLL